MSSYEIIDKFRSCYEPNIQIDALCDMAKIEVDKDMISDWWVGNLIIAYWLGTNCESS